MKKFKTIDCWISAVLISSFIILSLIRLDSIFITGYFVIGSWQVTSIVVHVFNSSFTIKGGNRYIYHRFILVIAILIAVLAVMAFMFEIMILPAFIILLLLLVCSPFMAVYYTYICYNEVSVKMQRPLAALK